MLAEDGSVLTETSAKLQGWWQHYATALCKTPPPLSDSLQHFANNGTSDVSIGLDPPSITETKDATKKLPASRAPGADGPTGEMLEAAADSFAPPITATLLARLEQRAGAH